MNSRVGPMISTVTYNDNGTKRKVMYEGSLGGMIVLTVILILAGTLKRIWTLVTTVWAR